jgi:hypothetical protein
MILKNEILRFGSLSLIFLLLTMYLSSANEKSDENIESNEVSDTKSYYFPKVTKQYEFNFTAGLSITFLPIAVVEEEINSSPLINLGMKMSLSDDIYSVIDFGSNYIANIGSFGVYYNIINRDLTIGLGVRGAIWFGHLDFAGFKLKSTGAIFSPELHAGIDLGSMKLSSSFEVENNYLYTTSDDKKLGEWIQKLSGFTFRINLEQPLWKDHWVSTSIKLNYNKFYYQSWLSFTNVEEYLLYPEFSFGFNL